jgi:hypothetical protein
MVIYREIIELREKLVKGEITLDIAKELFWKDHKKGLRSWHTKDWKERRDKIIKEKCEICGSTETLTLQHRSHPRQYHEYENEITRKYNQLYVASNNFIEQRDFIEHVKNNFEYVPVPLCVKCNSRYPNKRMRKKPQYLCTECRLEFDEPVYKSIEELIGILYLDEDNVSVRDKCFITKDKYKNHQQLSQIKYWLQRKKANFEFSDKIGKEAFLLYLEDNIKYLSFEDTITACKKCAFNFDINKMELCPKCKKYYKGILYPSCINCLPEDKRKIVMEKIEFAKECQAMHKELGID